MGNGTSIGRVRGLGSAHEGAHHWLVQRFTAIGNLALMLFLAFSLALLPDYSYGTVAGWAAQTLGASPLRRFLSISLPLSLPGIFAGAMLGFARSIGEFGATITFVSDIPGETRTLPIAIYAALQVPGAEAAVSRFAIISVLLSLGALLISELLARRATQGRMPHVL